MASNRVYRRQQRGAALVEFALTFMIFMMLLLAIVEFALFVFDASRLSEATRTGARYAITNNPACNIFGREAGDADTGCDPVNTTMDCDDPAKSSVSVEISNCSSDTPGCRLVEQMDMIMLRSENSILAEGGKVRITYSCSNTGDPGIPILIPEVTVEAVDVQHPLMFSAIFGFYEPGGGLGPSITLPGFKTTRTGEDMFNR